ncbi:MAG: AMP-binding protein [Gammaproteobacteria bacterium]|nr:AMP-binding protein [Gammaproteobacteria bacterium]
MSGNEVRSVRSLGERFLSSLRDYPDNPALEVDGRVLSYRELYSVAQPIAERLEQRPSSPRRSAVLVSRSMASFVGILAAALAGHAYVPINSGFPRDRQATILARSRATSLVCAAGDLDSARAIVESEQSGSSDNPCTVIGVDEGGPVTGEGFESVEQIANLDEDGEDLAYIMFTSGSTGVPKGVPITQANISAYLESVCSILDIRPGDRFSQTFELSFDFSVHDLWACWSNAGCLVVAQLQDLLEPEKYLKRNAITCVAMVPSLGRKIQQGGKLKQGTFSRIRNTVFGGEALPADLALDWLAAAPDSLVENWYGPTEAAVLCTRFGCTNDSLSHVGSGELAPIGNPFPGMKVRLVEESGCVVDDSEVGELLLAGPQVMPGYLEAPELDEQSFRVLDDGDRYYRTGDLARYDDQGILRYVDRIDNQVKVRGFRIELGEIEAALRSLLPSRNIVATPYPAGSTNPENIVAVVEGGVDAVTEVIAGMRNLVPGYMVPACLLSIERVPINVNGKFDRKAVDSFVSDKLGQGAIEQALDAHTQQDSVEKPDTDSPVDIEALLELVETITPGLDRNRTVESPSLFEAGMDSMGFMGFTLALEQRHKIEITQEDVAILSRLSLPQMVDALNGRQEFEHLRTGHQFRALRAHQFLDEFAEFVLAQDRPLVLLLGSSGLYRGFDTAIFDHEYHELTGRQIRSVNIGLPALSMEGLAKVWEFVRDTCRELEADVECAVIEFDPMLVCSIPPAGDLDVVKDRQSGKSLLGLTRELQEDFAWLPERAGSVRFNTDGKVVGLPNWQRMRNTEIIQTYRGRLALDDDLLASWVRGARAVGEVASHSVGFVQPLAEPRVNRFLPWTRPSALDQCLMGLERLASISIENRFYFDLDREDFQTLNHVNPQQGTRKFSTQIAQLAAPRK